MSKDTRRMLAIDLEPGSKLSEAIATLVKKKKASFFVKIAVQRYLETPEGMSQYKDFTGEETLSAGEGAATTTAVPPPVPAQNSALARSLVR